MQKKIDSTTDQTSTLGQQYQEALSKQHSLSQELSLLTQEKVVLTQKCGHYETLVAGLEEELREGQLTLK